MADANASGNTPSAENPATPAGGDRTPSQPSTEDLTVTLSKQEYADLKRKEAHLGTAQIKADSLEKELARLNKRKIEKPETLLSSEVLQAKDIINSKIFTNPEYQRLTASSPELSKVLSQQPWLLLDESEFVDAKDLASQVVAYLDKRVQSIKETEAAAAEAAANETPPAPLPTTTPTSETTPPAENPDETKTKERQAKMKPMERIEDKISGRIRLN